MPRFLGSNNVFQISDSNRFPISIAKVCSKYFHQVQYFFWSSLDFRHPKQPPSLFFHRVQFNLFLLTKIFLIKLVKPRLWLTNIVREKWYQSKISYTKTVSLCIRKSYHKRKSSTVSFQKKKFFGGKFYYIRFRGTFYYRCQAMWYKSFRQVTF